MKGETVERRRTLMWALPASLILHVLIAAFLIYGLPTPPEPPPEEPPVNVALVPPPEPPKPKPAPAPPPPKPEAQKPPEQKVEKPAPEKPDTIDVLKPVFQFGDKDTGPKKSLDGGSAQDNASPKDNDPKPTPKDAESKPAPAPDPAKPAEPTKTDEKPVTETKETEPVQEKQPAQDTSKPEADKQEAGAPEADKQGSAAEMALATPGDEGEIELPASAQAPSARPKNVPKPSPAKAAKSGGAAAGEPGSKGVAEAASKAYSSLPGVRKLFSQGATGDMVATNSMADVPRDQRGARLCASVLEQELRDASYSPQLIPSIPLKAGNVLDAPDTAFRSAMTWYHLSFRCGVDTDATRVVSFAFRVGVAATPEESAFLEREAHRRRGPAVTTQ